MQLGLSGDKSTFECFQASTCDACSNKQTRIYSTLSESGGVPGWQTGDPCHPWCPPSLCPPPVPFQLITISWFIQTIHQSDLIIHCPKIWIIKHLKPCLSVSAITIRSMCCCLLLKEGKNESVFVCAREGFGQNHPSFHRKRSISFLPLLHTYIQIFSHSKRLMDNSHWNNWLFVHWSGWVNNGWLHQGLLHPERLTDSSL